MIKLRIRQFLAHCLWPVPVSVFHHWASIPLVVVNYHSIRGWDPDAAIRKKTYRTAAQMEHDFRYFKKHYRPVTLTQVLAWQKGEATLPPKALLVTFDDGLSVVYSHIRPLLKQHQIPAVCFVNPAFLSGTEMHYQRKVNALQQELNRTNCTLLQVMPHQPGDNPPIQSLSEVTYLRRALLDEVALRVGIRWDAILKQQPVYLSESEIEEMIGEGFFFGAHSWDHPPYSELTQEARIQQTVDSADWLARRFGLAYRAFAFPYRDKWLNRSLFRSISPHIDLSFGTQGFLRDCMPNHLHRVDVERSRLPVGLAMRWNYARYFFQRLTGRKEWNRLE